MKGPATVLGFAVAAAAGLCVWALSLGVPLLGALVLACGPLAFPGAPAGLLLAATIRRGDGYDVTHKYRRE